MVDFAHFLKQNVRQDFIDLEVRPDDPDGVGCLENLVLRRDPALLARRLRDLSEPSEYRLDVVLRLEEFFFPLLVDRVDSRRVAPFTGAWIEIFSERK